VIHELQETDNKKAGRKNHHTRPAEGISRERVKKREFTSAQVAWGGRKKGSEEGVLMMGDLLRENSNGVVSQQWRVRALREEKSLEKGKGSGKIQPLAKPFGGRGTRGSGEEAKACLEQKGIMQ